MCAVRYGLLCSLLLTTRGMAQAPVLGWQKLSEGGGLSSCPAYQMISTIGQADANSGMTNSRYSLSGGFWVLSEGPAIVSVIPATSHLFCCPSSSQTLTVIPSGTPPLFFQWRRNGTNLMDGPNIVGAATASLTLPSVTPDVAGAFDVEVRNAYGSATSAPVNLVVTLKPGLAVPIVSNGSIVGATLVDGGCGYATAPLISFTGSGGAGAMASASIFDGIITNIQIVSGGSGYSSNALLIIDPPVYPTVRITLGASNVLSLNAGGLMAGMIYQLEAATDLFTWHPSDAFQALDTTWRPTNVWSVSVTNRLYLRLQMSQ